MFRLNENEMLHVSVSTSECLCVQCEGGLEVSTGRTASVASVDKRGGGKTFSGKGKKVRAYCTLMCQLVCS